MEPLPIKTELALRVPQLTRIDDESVIPEERALAAEEAGKRQVGAQTVRFLPAPAITPNG